VTLADGQTSTPIGMALTGIRVDKLDEPDARRRAGMSGYLFPFVIISMHLLVVLIGAGYMARTKRFGGAALERVAVTEPRVRRRSFAVSGGLISGIIANLVLAALTFGYWLSPEVKAWFGRFNASLPAAADWLYPLLGGLFLANMLLLAVVYLWQSWAAIGLVAVPLFQAAAIGNSGLGGTAAIVFLVLMLAPVLLLIVLLTTGRRPTMWEQMD
jgi:hypothetical protein